MSTSVSYKTNKQGQLLRITQYPTGHVRTTVGYHRYVEKLDSTLNSDTILKEDHRDGDACWIIPGYYLRLFVDGEGYKWIESSTYRPEDDHIQLAPTDEEQFEKNKKKTIIKSKESICEKMGVFNEELYEETIRPSGKKIILPDYVIKFLDEVGVSEPEERRVHTFIVLPHEFFSTGFKNGRTDEIIIIVKNLSKGMIDTVIKYLYTGKIEYSEIMDIFEEIIILADYLLLSEFITTCFQFHFFHTGEIPFINVIPIEHYKNLRNLQEDVDFEFEHDYNIFNSMVHAILEQHRH